MGRQTTGEAKVAIVKAREKVEALKRVEEDQRAGPYRNPSPVHEVVEYEPLRDFQGEEGYCPFCGNIADHARRVCGEEDMPYKRKEEPCRYGPKEHIHRSCNSCRGVWAHRTFEVAVGVSPPPKVGLVTKIVAVATASAVSGGGIVWLVLEVLL